MEALVSSGFPVVCFDADALGEEEIAVVGDEGFIEEDFDAFLEFLVVDGAFFLVEFGGDGGVDHVVVHLFVHLADLVDGGESPFGVSEADGVEIEGLCAQEIAGFVVEILFHEALGESEGTAKEA